MSHWHYQIIHHQGEHPYFGLHEVHEFEGGLRSWTEEPIRFMCGESEGPEGITESLSMALADANTYPVLDDVSQPAERGGGK